jgi:hypothetical protein
MDFRWVEWNIEHLARHGVESRGSGGGPSRGLEPISPAHRGRQGFGVGAGRGGRLLQVVFVLDEDQTVFVIRARELTNREKSVLRRKRR